MRLACKNCNGEGVITCSECDGDGVRYSDIKEFQVMPGHPYHDELCDLKADAKRLTELADKLCALRPERATSYQQQLEGCLSVVNRQAEKLWRKHEINACE
jgi:hypothetical protein